MSGWSVSSRSIGALNGVTLKRPAPSLGSNIPDTSAKIKVMSGTMHIKHAHDVRQEGQLVAERLVKLDIDLGRGIANGIEQLIGGNVSETLTIQDVALGNNGDSNSRLPISKARIRDYLSSVITWLTGENGTSLHKDHFVFSTKEGRVDLNGSDDPAAVFDALQEIDQSIKG
ncbi:MAG: hypothetical protein WC632_02780 [Candidatus Margulisiibacteriota bacterium]